MANPRSVLDCEPLRPQERFDAWTDAVNRSFVPLTVDRVRECRGVPFAGKLISQPLGQTVVSMVEGSAVRVRRTPTQIARADPGYLKLGLQVDGVGVISQGGRSARLDPGDFALYDTSRPYSLDFGDPFRMFVVMFPIAAIRMDHDRISQVTASTFSGHRRMGAITSRLLGTMSEQVESNTLSPELSLSDAVLDLVGATVAELLEQAAPSEHGQRRALRAQIEAFIATHLGEPALSVTNIAAAHHVSVRYLQKLFEEHDLTVSGWVRTRRLEQSRRDLVDPALSRHTIGEIGARWGFTDATAFARAFRLEFGVKPSTYRASVNRD